MILYTDRLLLRPWEPSDSKELFELARNPQIGNACGWQPHRTEEDSKEIIKTVLSAPQTYAIVSKTTGRLLGSIGLLIGQKSNLTLSENQCEIGFWVGVPYWGQGFAPEAVNALLQYAFSKLNMEKVWCISLADNTNSSRVQQKCGFKFKYSTNELNISNQKTVCVSVISKE